MKPATDPQTENAWLYRYTVLVAVIALFLVVSGAFVASQNLLSASSEASSGQVQQPDTTPITGFSQATHPLLGRSLGVLVIGLVIWVFATETDTRLRKLSGLALLIVLGQAGIGEAMLPGVMAGQLASSAMSIIHAWLAPVLFSILVVIAVLLSSGWRRGPELITDKSAAMLRLLASLTPALVAVQIFLGAAYRHKVIGVMLHMAGAGVVTFLILVLSVQVMQKFPKHRSLSVAAMTLMGVTLLQVSLGITVFILELLGTESTVPVVLSTAAHVMTGTLTLATSVVFWIQLLRNVQEAAPQQEGAPSAGTTPA